jgi:hypothetical protein
MIDRTHLATPQRTVTEDADAMRSFITIVPEAPWISIGLEDWETGIVKGIHAVSSAEI